MFHSDRVRISRTALVVLWVVALHAAVLWVLQAGLIRRAFEVIVAAEIIAPWIENDAVKPESIATNKPPENKKLSKQKEPSPPAPAQTAQAQPEFKPPNEVAPINDPQPAATAVAPKAQTLPSTQQSTVSVATTPPARLELPSSDALYLHNPKPSYPGISKRLGEQGRVIVRVLIGVDGIPQKAEIQQSSGFDRLDQTALSTVSAWRFVPGKRSGVPEAMWFNVPVNFVLE